MNLTWHIIRKDARRMAPAVATWLALVVLAALAVRLTSIPNEVALGGDGRAWVNGMRLMAGGLTGAGAVLAVLVVAQLVQEDGLIGTEAMWLTRPIGRGRLLAAKLLGAAVMLVAMPVLALLPIWLASGFSPGELARAAGQLAAGQAGLILVAASMAAMTRDLGKFVFGLVGLTLVMAVRMIFPIDRSLPEDVLESRVAILVIFGPGAVAAAGAVQYFTRRTGWAWMIMGVGLVLVAAASVGWPWATFAGLPGVTSRWPSGRVAAAIHSVRVEKIVVPAEAGAMKTIYIQAGPMAAADEFVMPWNGVAAMEGKDGPAIRGGIEPGGRWGEAAVQRLLGLAPKAGPLMTAMELRQSTPAEPDGFGAGGTLTGELRMARVRARILGEWPWRAGASAWAGSSFTRVVGVVDQRAEGRGEVRIEEREMASGGLMTPWAAERGEGAARRDCFALVNRRLGIFQALRVVEGGVVRANSLLLSERTLEYEVPKGAAEDWVRDAVLVKVRFEVVERWTKMLTREQVPVVTEEKKS